MTGAGRSTAAKELEDLGFFVVDNLPPELLRDVVRLVDESQGTGPADRGRGRRTLRRRSSTRSQANLAPGRDRPAHDPAVPRGHRRRARPPPGGRPPAAPAAGRAAGCSTGSSASARCSPTCAATPTWSSTPPTSTSTSSPTGSPRRSATPTTTRLKVDRGQLRLQVRHPGRRRLRRRHAVPAEPVLDPRAAPAAPAATPTVADYVLSQPGAARVPRPLRARARGRRRRATCARASGS